MARDRPPHKDPQTIEHEQLPPPVLGEQTRAAEPEPPVAPLIKAPEGEDRPPSAPFAAAGPTPRFVHDNLRVAPGSGLARFKVRCVNYDAQPYRYVLAASEEEARRYYVEATGLAALVKSAKDGGVAVAEPWLSVKKLPD